MKLTQKTKRIIALSVSALLFLIALVLYLNPVIRNKAIASGSNEYTIMRVEDNKIKENAQKVKEGKVGNFDMNSVEPLDAQAVIQERLSHGNNASNNTQGKREDSFLSLGGIAIPELGMNLPIFAGLDNESLYYGAGTMDANQVMGQGNYALASHHVFGIAGDSEMLFSPLERAQNGQKIYLTDKSKVYTYEIDTIKRVKPDQGAEVLAERITPTVTLITCTDAYATERIIVQATLVDETEWSARTETMKNAFDREYNKLWYW